MNLWIRSQDKHKMLKCELLKYEEYEESFGIRGFTSSDNWTIGYYNTKERALEVLDEIQQRLINLQLVSLEEKGQARKDAVINDNLKCVYEMPEK